MGDVWRGGHGGVAWRCLARIPRLKPWVKAAAPLRRVHRRVCHCHPDNNPVQRCCHPLFTSKVRISYSGAEALTHGFSRGKPEKQMSVTTDARREQDDMIVSTMMTQDGAWRCLVRVSRAVPGVLVMVVLPGVASHVSHGFSRG